MKEIKSRLKIFLAEEDLTTAVKRVNWSKKGFRHLAKLVLKLHAKVDYLERELEKRK